MKSLEPSFKEGTPGILISIVMIWPLRFSDINVVSSMKIGISEVRATYLSI